MLCSEPSLFAFVGVEVHEHLAHDEDAVELGSGIGLRESKAALGFKSELVS